jgi:hypothetical protein
VTTPHPDVLLSPETLALAQELGALDSRDDLVTQVSTLRKAGHPPERVHHALEQVRLRRRAHTKLGPFADRMLFTESGLEQATRLQVAAHHAGRVAQAGVSHIADLGCGLGVNAMAFAAVGLAVTAYDSDELTAALATYNLSPFDHVTVHHGDALTADLTGVDAAWFDPARRSGGHRLSDPGDWSPSLDRVFRLAEAMPCGIKLAPGIDRDLLPTDAEWQWVSVGGDVVEVTVWTKTLARAGVGRSALLIGAEESHELTAATDSEDEPVGPLGRYLVEPDGAIIRARLIGEVARQIGGRMISATIAYITCDTLPDTPFGQVFEIQDVLPLKTPAIKKWVREKNIGTLEIKKRGVDIDPAALRPTLTLRGSEQATLILTRLGDKRVALAATRVARQEKPRDN